MIGPSSKIGFNTPPGRVAPRAIHVLPFFLVGREGKHALNIPHGACCISFHSEHLVPEVREARCREVLGQQVCHHFVCRAVYQLDLAVADLGPHVVVL